MNPSHFELATIAAAMANSQERVDVTAWRAMRLWEACGERLEHERRAADSASPRFDADFEPYKAVPLDDFMKALMPSSKAPDRMARWREFTRYGVMAGDAYHRHFSPSTDRSEKSPDEVSAMVDEALRRDREEGIPWQQIYPTRDAFDSWRDRDSAEKKSNRGKNAVAARYAKKGGNGKKSNLRK